MSYIESMSLYKHIIFYYVSIPVWYCCHMNWERECVLCLMIYMQFIRLLDEGLYQTQPICSWIGKQFTSLAITLPVPIQSLVAMDWGPQDLGIDKKWCYSLAWQPSKHYHTFFKSLVEKSPTALVIILEHESDSDAPSALQCSIE